MLNKERDELKRAAQTEGAAEGVPYYWTDASKGHQRSQNYRLPDGRVVGIPDREGFPVEIHHPDGRVEYL